MSVPAAPFRRCWLRGRFRAGLTVVVVLSAFLLVAASVAVGGAPSQGAKNPTGVAHAAGNAAPGGEAALTEAQARERAQAFLRAVHATYEDAQPVSVSTEPKRSDALRFAFTAGGWISVQKQTGAVVCFMDLARPLNEETGKRISEEDAKARALECLALAGVTLEDGVFKNVGPALIINDGEPPIVLIATWGRVYKGCPVLDDNINVEVDGQTGAIVALGDWFTSKMPTDMTPRISQQEAESIASSLARRDTTWTAKLVIVGPWDIPHAERPADRCEAQTRLAWQVLPPDDGLQFTIDAMTGEELSRGGPRGSQPPSGGSAAESGRGVVFPEARERTVERVFPYIGGILAALAAVIGLIAVRAVSARRVRSAQASREGQ